MSALLKKVTGTRFRQFLLLSILLPGIFTTLLIAFFFLHPIGFRKVIYQPIREALLFQRELDPVFHWNHIERISIPPARRVLLPSGDQGGPNIVADLRLPDGEDRVPAVLLLHGSARWARKTGLIRLLSLRLASERYITLAPDARGFGDSADPEEIHKPESWEAREDVGHCIAYLLKHPRTDPERIYVFGHSMGADHALEGALEDRRVRALILVGPSRMLEGNDPLSYWMRVRFSAERDLNRPVSQEVLRARLSRSNIAFYSQGILKKKGHKPVLLIDGQLEGEVPLTYLAGVAKSIALPITYLTLPRTGHYCGVMNGMSSESVYYRPDLFDPFLKIVLNYMKQEQDRKESPTTPVVNASLHKAE